MLQIRNILFLSIMSSTALADTSLCDKSTTVFSCEFEHAIMSVCQNKKELSFKFGKPNAIGMTYPSPGEASNFTFGSNGDEKYLEFDRRDTKYRISSKPHDHSLILKQGDKEINKMLCKEPNKGFAENTSSLISH